MEAQNKDKISIFGAGFVLGKFAEMFPDDVIVMPRDEINSITPNILYGISTVHNYHPKEGDPFIDIETNLLHFMKVLDDNVNEETVFNLVSSWFVYGANPSIPAKEYSFCDPKGFYSITARAREQLLISYCQTFNLKYRILRLGNVIGVGDRKISPKKNALQWMIRELVRGNEVKIYKSGGVRDFIDVRDCARAIKLVLDRGDTNMIYNIANGRGLNIKDLVEHAWAGIGYKGKIGEIEVPAFHRQVQAASIYLDITRLKSLGYVQQHDIRNSVLEIAEHYLTNEF